MWKIVFVFEYLYLYLNKILTTHLYLNVCSCIGIIFLRICIWPLSQLRFTDAYMWVLRKILTGACGPGFHNHTLGYGDRGPFEAILHEIGQIWPKCCHLLWKDSEIRSKWPKFVEDIPLAMEPQPKLDPWLWKSGSKRDPCRRPPLPVRST